MDSLRFIHAADLHLDSPFKGLRSLPAGLFEKMEDSTYTALKRLADTAIRERVDFVLIAGDVFDNENRSLQAQLRFNREMSRVAREGIDVYIMHGNHDHFSGTMNELSWPDNVHFFPPGKVKMLPFYKKDLLVAGLYGFSYQERAATENMTGYYRKEPGPLYHIGVLHGSEETSEGHSRYAPFKTSELVEKDFDYWALGHIHKRSRLSTHPPIIYPGNLQGRHRKESGEKGFYLVEMQGPEEAAELHFHSAQAVKWSTIDLPINGLSNVTELTGLLEEKMEETRTEGNGVLLDIRFIGDGPLHTELQEEDFLEDLASILNEGEELEDSFVWVNSWQIETVPHWNREDLAADGHFLGDLIRAIDGFEEIEETLAPLYRHKKGRKYLPRLGETEKRQLLEDAERLLLNELLKEMD
ncbi:metallophosphoesterase family protein [Bacillus marinisedimentorum]|uniref:metallophosphoesterase family protein n=1 Tax=Bacillus marinisedimentorum TaxID=1821260 RepID=UPI0007E0CA2B|nr:DNA repair exonuclease [Bacillus marinisedimentorum]